MLDRRGFTINSYLNHSSGKALGVENFLSSREEFRNRV